MNIHEYQAKDLLRQFGVAVPNGYPCFSVAEAVQAAERLGGTSWVVKAQTHAGARHAAHSVHQARSISELRDTAGRMLGMTVGNDAGQGGRVVRRLLVEEVVDVRKALYLGLALDRSRQKVVLTASSDGGMDIEQVEALSPERVCAVHLDPINGLGDHAADDVAHKMGVPDASIGEARTFIRNFCRMYDACDATLAEINPLALTRQGKLVALDVRIDFDPNALYRHPEIESLRDPDEESQDETEAARHDLTYVLLKGDIGCLVNGAGLAMATMDAIRLRGGEPANFLDVGGGATTERVTEAFRIMLRKPGLKAILTNIFGGATRCDVMARGIVNAARQVELNVPLVVRLQGANELAGRRILMESGLPIIPAFNMADASERVVRAAKGE